MGWDDWSKEERNELNRECGEEEKVVEEES